MNTTLSASVSGKSNVLRTQIADLTERERQLLDALQETRARLTKSREQLAEAERASERVRSPSARSPVSEATWRRVVRELGTFTVSELATELGCTKQTAKKHLDTMIEIEMVAPAGRAMGKALYEYTKPTGGPGEAFESQRAKRRHLVAVEEPVADLAPKRRPEIAGVTKNPVTTQVGDKNVRQACEEAQRRGWKIQRKGDGHFVLVKGARRVPVPSTPRSGTEAADRIRRMTRER